MQEKTLVIWHTNSMTSYFNNVTNSLVDRGTLTFDYFGKESQTLRKAQFRLANISGFAITKTVPANDKGGLNW